MKEQDQERKKTISVNNLSKIYDMGAVKVHALRGIDMDINEGEFTAIMGHSGSGKSTLLNILGCLDVPTEGKYYLDGADVSHLNKNQLAGMRNRKIGFVHLGREDFLYWFAGIKASVYVNPGFRSVYRCKKRESLYMIPVSMCKKHVYYFTFIFF